jgi:hypothetical protein
MYENGKVRSVEIILRMGEKEIKENDRGMNLAKIYCKHFVNVTMYPSTTII